MSKGGSTTSNTEIPAWLESAAIENINKARDVSQIGYTPYYGADVAAFSPMQQQSMQSTGNAASAFGLAPQGFDAMAGMPQSQTFANGMQGYSSAPLFEQAKDNLYANAPAQYNAMADMFIDPFTGAAPRSGYGATAEQARQMVSSGGGGGGDGAGNDPFTINRGQTDGDYYGVNSQYNPYKYSTPTEDISGDGVIDYRDMSFGEGGRRDIPMSEGIIDFLNPFSGIPKMIDAAGGLLFDASGVGDPSMTPSESVNQMNTAAARYEARLAADAARAEQSMIRPMPTGGLINTDNNPLLRGDLATALNNEYALQTALRDEELQVHELPRTTPYVAPVINTVNSGGGGNNYSAPSVTTTRKQREDRRDNQGPAGQSSSSSAGNGTGRYFN